MHSRRVLIPAYAMLCRSWSYQLSSSNLDETLAGVRDLMSSFRPDWALCGGWAVDSWLGRQARDHGDVDITVFADDQRALFVYFDGWRLVAHDANVDQETDEPWDGRPLDLPAHIHASKDGAFALEIVVNERDAGGWLLDPPGPLEVPWADAVRTSPWGVPTVSPELVLFYKATAYFADRPMWDRRAHDETDFLALLPIVPAERRAWLRAAIAVTRPGHPWLAHFADTSPS